MLRTAFVSIVATLAFAIACGSSTPSGDHQSFATFQDCYQDHHVMEMFPTNCAIEICCIDHPIGNAKMNVVCGETAAACQSYVGSNLTDSTDTMLGSDITKACTDYIFDSQRPGATGSGGKCG
jgi:hypothetical protein